MLRVRANAQVLSALDEDGDAKVDLQDLLGALTGKASQNKLVTLSIAAQI